MTKANDAFYAAIAEFVKTHPIKIQFRTRDEAAGFLTHLKKEFPKVRDDAGPRLGNKWFLMMFWAEASLESDEVEEWEFFASRRDLKIRIGWNDNE